MEALLENPDDERRRLIRDSKARWVAKNPEYQKEWARNNLDKRRVTSERYREKLSRIEKPAPDTLKHCSACQSYKPRADFTPNNRTLDGRHPICRVCNTARNHGLSGTDFEALWAKAGGKCEICEAQLVRGIKNGFAIDHDHETGVIRGLLCSACNLAIGKFLDRADLCHKAGGYLERTKCGS